MKTILILLTSLTLSSCTVALKDGTVVTLDGAQAANLATAVAALRGGKSAQNVQP